MRRAVSRIITSGPTKFLQSGMTTSHESSNYKIDFNSVEDFYIILEDPHKSWQPGDEVAGQIIFISKKNLANIVITLSLIGHVMINASSHSKLRHVKQTLFNHRIKICGEELGSNSDKEDFNNGLYKGEHRFPFIVKLPNKRVFTSVDFGKGSIQYLLRAAVGDSSSFANNSPASSPPSDSSNTAKPKLLSRTKNLKFHNSIYTCEKIIILINPIDVSKLSRPRPKRLIIRDPRQNRKLSRTQSSTSTINTVNTYGTMSSNNSDTAPNGEGNTPVGPHSMLNSPLASHEAISFQVIKASLEISEKGYLRGELIPIKININHSRKIQDLNGIIITMVRVCRLNNGHENLFESFRKDLQQLVLPLYVDPNTFQAEINTNIRVPADAFPTISGCPLVSFQYFIEVLINLSGKPIVLDGANHQTSNDEANHHTLPDSQARDFKFNFQPNTSLNERSGFINTDKYKRMKKFLQITSEIIIGTTRLVHNRDDALGQVLNENSHVSPASRRSSQFAESPLGFSQPDSSSPSQQNFTRSSFDMVPEGTQVHTFNTPPYFESERNPMGAGDMPIPGYAEILNNDSRHEYNGAIPIPEQPELSEKEQMRIHEAGLLPSEPPTCDSNDERETISPIDENDNILENIEELEETSILNDESRKNSVTNGQNFEFFTHQNSSATATPTDNQGIDDEEDDEEDELYRASNTITSIDEIDNRLSDFVPTYEAANNDRILTANRINTVAEPSNVTSNSNSNV